MPTEPLPMDERRVAAPPSPSVARTEEDELLSADCDQVRGVYSFRGPVVTGVLAGLIAAGAAVEGAFRYWDFLGCSDFVGAINTVGLLVFFSGLLLSLAVVLSRHQAKPLTVVLLLGAAVLASAVGILAADSATYTRTCSDFWSGHHYTESQYLGYLYVPWGGALAMFLLAAAGVFARVRRSRRSGGTGAVPRTPGNLVSQGTR